VPPTDHVYNSDWWDVVTTFGKHLWPEEKRLRNRVVLAVGLLVGSKLMTIQVPILFKQIIDAMNVSGDLMLAIPFAALIGCSCSPAI
jgi:ABC transporter ATM